MNFDNTVHWEFKLDHTDQSRVMGLKKFSKCPIFTAPKFLTKFAAFINVNAAIHLQAGFKGPVLR
jgi:hypothetical protein